MAFDLLNMGSQGVLTAQRQLNTTSHNINNVNTEGYSRQSVVQQSNDPIWWGGSQYGTGVHVAEVRRGYDQFATNELNLTTTNLSYANERDSQLGRLDNMLSNSAKKIPDDMNNWYDAVKALSDSPNDMGSRKVVMEKAKLVAAGLNENYNVLARQKSETNEVLSRTLNRVNDIAKELVDVHQTLLKSPATNNDLMDRHQALINELSEYTKVTVTPKNDNTFNIMIGSGHTLVSGTEASELRMVNGQPDSHQTQLAIREGQSLKTIRNDGIGGKLAALFQYRDETLTHAQDEVGRMAIGFAHTVNGLQQQGMDLNGQVGQDMFRDMNDPTIAASRVVLPNDSTADVKVYIDDVNALKKGEYSLSFDGSQHALVTPDGERQKIMPSGNPPAFTVDGFRVEMDAPLRAGEHILLRPTRTGAADISVAMKDPSQIAAQSYLSSASQVQGKADFAVTQRGPLSEFQVAISPDASQYAVLDMKGGILQNPMPYPPSGEVNVQGTVFTLSQGAAGGDVFAVNLRAAQGDNGNLLRMQALQSAKVMDEGRSSVLDVYQGLNTEMGVQKASAARLKEVGTVENEAAASRVAEISGVNLDEEAANMMKFQQAYMASSRIMTVANETFDTLLNVAR
ncbi:flagellar hook-associated protein FlgK [Photobacterium aphoticum]|uniref:Flagellar hook-associated protein 1 n=1 Tax=Photobacterium aphoticum TaxID=754436 RepID=A0A0J1GSX0_9GAMM|nr:flagellar hook-associated protein FlgK [Photobacterium aphoticum]KLV02554.1 flagellar hook protein FlgK [Photobacterium aphoticum]PSU54580.1 flagellar hook-associated protein FlgK [Photobacterium aphoticum]GHA47367.1 flagellar hook protein FlgK [Photobacterium aphoticum]